jgi:heme exporter protein D
MQAMNETRGRNTFVPALRDPAPQVVEVETNWRELPTAPISAPMPYSGHVDRAKGFSLATAPLAGVTGFIVLLIGISAFGVPLLSVGALLLALGGFAAVWLVAYIAHTLISTDGALVIHTVMAWGYLNQEAKERRKRYGLNRGSN